MKRKEIRNLLFDLGGVIMDIKRENCVKAFERLGMKDADSYLGEYSQNGPFACIEDGSCTIDEFHESIRHIIGTPVTDAEIDQAFGCFLTGIPRHRLDELERLHRRYRIYMLSNTNPIMWADGIDRNFRQCGKDVNHYFDGIVRSYKAGAMKPDPRIFATVIDTLHIDPAETLFLDDSQRNLDAAAALGFQTQLVAPGSEFYNLLTQHPGIETSD